MTAESHLSRLEQLVLGAVLSLGAAFLAFFVVLGMAAVGVPDPPIHLLSVAAVGLGAIVAGQVSPVLVPSARLLAPWRRVVAGIVGFVAGVLVAQVMTYMGVDTDDRDYSTTGLIQKMTAMTRFYLTMVVAAAACLGSARPPRP
jgi:hypothetical protein